MSIRIVAVGKKHESWVTDGISRYEKRLRKPFDISWQLLPHSSREGNTARTEESDRLLAKLSSGEFVVLLDERGKLLDSPALAASAQRAIDAGRRITCLIGGAYGVDDRVRDRADLVWSLSPLVFPHQLVRLIVTEQLYRAQQILAGGAYHHE